MGELESQKLCIFCAFCGEPLCSDPTTETQRNKRPYSLPGLTHIIQRRANNYKSLKDKIAKLHKRINCQRDDFLHKLSRAYVNNFDIICVEDLDIKGLKEKGHNNGMHRSIHDASWSKFIFMLSYKAQSAGRKLIKVDPRNTTQRCSACGSIVKKDLSVRVHECPYCGFSCDRDYNASRNILFAGMEQPVAPIEPKPLHHISVMQVLAMTWEAAPFRTRQFTPA